MMVACSFFHKFTVNMAKACRLARINNHAEYNGVGAWLMRLRAVESTAQFKVEYAALLDHVRRTFADTEGKQLLNFLRDSQQAAYRWSAACGQRRGSLDTFTSNANESWHSQLKETSELNLGTNVVDVFIRDLAVQQRVEASRRLKQQCVGTLCV